MQSEAAIRALGALAQEHRLAAFRLLVEAGPKGLSAGVLAQQLSIAPSSLSFHLAQLAHAGLVKQDRQGRSIFYSADFAEMNQLLAYLTENCCGGGEC
jgi:DNA-binding transcriptional ArsR family regulator